MKYETKAFPEFVGKPIQELWDFLKESPEYKDRLATLPEDYDNWEPPEHMKDGNWYYFLGSAFRYSDGYWMSPYGGWSSAEWLRDGRGVRGDWHSVGRVVLFGMDTEPLKLPVDTLNIETAVDYLKSKGYKVTLEK